MIVPCTIAGFDMTIRRNPRFPHLCPGDGCAICLWVAIREGRS